MRYWEGHFTVFATARNKSLGAYSEARFAAGEAVPLKNGDVILFGTDSQLKVQVCALPCASITYSGRAGLSHANSNRALCIFPCMCRQAGGVCSWHTPLSPSSLFAAALFPPPHTSMQVATAGSHCFPK